MFRHCAVTCWCIDEQSAILKSVSESSPQEGEIGAYGHVVGMLVRKNDSVGITRIVERDFAGI